MKRESLAILLLACLFAFPLFSDRGGKDSPTLTESNSGTLLSAWSEGVGTDTAIWLSILKEVWSPAQIIAEEKGTFCFDPVLFTLSDEILLFYKVGPNSSEWSGSLKRSFDEGKTWSPTENLPAGVIGPSKNRPLLLKEGTLLCGSSLESWKRWGCWIDVTCDKGHTWEKRGPINVENELYGIIQPTLFFGKKGVIKLLARSNEIGFICSAESTDLGKTWSSAQPTSLPNPNSPLDAINLADGRIALVYNHSKTYRYPLNLAVSKDKGSTWKVALTLEKGPGDYSSPTLLQTKEGNIHVCYIWNHQYIKHLVIDPKSF